MAKSGSSSSGSRPTRHSKKRSAKEAEKRPAKLGHSDAKPISASSSTTQQTSVVSSISDDQPGQAAQQPAAQSPAPLPPAPQARAGWRPWGDHPVVVGILVITAVVGLALSFANQPQASPPVVYNFGTNVVNNFSSADPKLSLTWEALQTDQQQPLATLVAQPTLTPAANMVPQRLIYRSGERIGIVKQATELCTEPGGPVATVIADQSPLVIVSEAFVGVRTWYQVRVSLGKDFVATGWISSQWVQILVELVPQ